MQGNRTDGGIDAPDVYAARTGSHPRVVFFNPCPLQPIAALRLFWHTAPTDLFEISFLSDAQSERIYTGMPIRRRSHGGGASNHCMQHAVAAAAGMAAEWCVRRPEVGVL